MHTQILKIAEYIERYEVELRELAETFRKTKYTIPDALESELILPTKEVNLNTKIAAVDGGLVAQEFHGFDLVLSRAVAVIFEYKGSERVSHQYYPCPSESPDMDALTGLEAHEFSLHKSLFRLKKEIELASKIAEKFKPEYIFLDGSIAPLISDKPSSDSALRLFYDNVISEYKRLYSITKEHGSQLVGVIKDSRGRRFIEILGKGIEEEKMSALLRSTDTAFLSFLLKHRERTCALKYGGKEEISLRDLGEWSGKICMFYLKPTEEDRPLRIEFLDINGNYDEMANVIYTLSRVNRVYAYPAILIEADLRAVLSRIELERAYAELLNRTGMRTSLLKLRRDLRPFR